MSVSDTSARDALDSLDARFGRAEQPADYKRVRDDALKFAEACTGLDAFRARVIAADCLYRAAVSGGRQDFISNLLAFPGELANAAEPVSAIFGRATPDLVERYARLVDATARPTLTRIEGDSEATTDWKRLAQVIEHVLPTDLAFSREWWGDDWRACSVGVAVGLGAVSLLYGDRDHGNARFRFALATSFEGGDLLGYRRSCDDVYGWMKMCWQLRPVLVTAIVDLQTAIFEHIDQWRSKHRSRAGRVWVAQLFDTLVGEFQRDMAEPVLPALNAAATAQALDPLFDLLRDRLFRAVEFGRSRLLLDQLSWGTRPFADAEQARQAIEQERALIALPPALPSDDPMVGRELQLVSRLPMLFWQHPGQDAAAYRAKTDQIQKLETIFSHQPAGLNEVEPVANLESVTEELRDGEAIIEFAIPRDTLHPAHCIYILAITNKGLRHIIAPLDALKQFPDFYKGDIGSLSVGGREPVEESPLGELVFQTRLAIQQSDSDRATIFLKLLNMLLVAPLAQIGISPEDFECWHLVPHGVLHMVPFRALIDADGRYLNDRVATCILPSASVWLMLHQPWAELTQFVGFGNPQLDPAQWRPLPNTEAEIKTAASLLTGMRTEQFVKADANLAKFAQWAPQSSILHVASHGEFPQSDVIDFHHIVLTPGPSDDGRLSAGFVRELNLHHTQLAVLSVCDGGLLRVSAGDELLGLVPAVLEAGANNVLTTLWEVDDAIARLWMREFYKTVGALGPAKAVKAACGVFIADGASLRDWAAFVLIGATIPSKGGRPDDSPDSEIPG